MELAFKANAPIFNLNRVLIVDDHPMIRDALRTIIEVAFDACEAMEATSIDEAVRLLESMEWCDVVLLDLTLPGVTGLDALRTLNTRFPSLPVVIVSGIADHTIADKAIEAGAIGFIPKQLRRGSIVEALKLISTGAGHRPCANSDPHLQRQTVDRINQLSPQQRAILDHVIEGSANKQIAYQMSLSESTVKAHVSAVLRKLGVVSRTQVVGLCSKVGYRARPSLDVSH
jgi:Response regulator containing a CheY-like receiver domain and an HTH DNA-binding domain